MSVRRSAIRECNRILCGLVKNYHLSDEAFVHLYGTIRDLRTERSALRKTVRRQEEALARAHQENSADA